MNRSEMSALSDSRFLPSRRFWTFVGACLAGALALAAPKANAAPLPRAPVQLVSSSEWQKGVSERVAKISRQDSTFAAALAQLAPILTRGRTLKFVSPLLAKPGALDLLAARLMDPKTPAAWHPALAAALEQSGDPQLAATIAQLLTIVSDPESRKNLVFALRRVDAAQATEANQVALSRGLHDPSLPVRVMAIRARGYQAARSKLHIPFDDDLISALLDQNVALVAEAIWACEMLVRSDVTDIVFRHLHHPEGSIRLSALRFAKNIAPAQLRASRELQRLASDPDRRVAELARAMISPQ